MAIRKAEAVWNGTLKEGSGSFKGASGALSGGYTFKSRFEEDNSLTNPEELVGAAHAGCYAMFLSAQLTNAGFPPESVHGALVAGTARKWPPTPPAGLVPLNADLTRRGEAERTVESAVTALGGLDIVVQLAGAFALEGPIDQTSIETFDRLLDLNLRAAFLTFRAAAPAVAHPFGRGRLLAIGALAALRQIGRAHV